MLCVCVCVFNYTFKYNAYIFFFSNLRPTGILVTQIREDIFEASGHFWRFQGRFYE